MSHRRSHRRGGSLIEYALLAALIGIALLGTLSQLRSGLHHLFHNDIGRVLEYWR